MSDRPESQRANTNSLRIVRTPPGLVAMPAGRGVYFTQNLREAYSGIPSGVVRMYLRRGMVAAPPININVDPTGELTLLAPTTGSFTPDSVDYTFPTGTNFQRQLIANITYNTQSTGVPGAVSFTLVGAPAGYVLEGTGNTRQLRFTGARPTELSNFIVRAESAASDTAASSRGNLIVTTGIVAPPQRTSLEIEDITRTNLESFTQDVSGLFTGTGLNWTAASLNPNVATVTLSSANVATISPSRDGVTVIRVVVSNAGGTRSYDFNVRFDVLAQPVVVWSDTGYDSTDGRYEFSQPAGAGSFVMGNVTARVSVPSPAVLGAVTYTLGTGLVGVLEWNGSTGEIRVVAGAGVRPLNLQDDLIVSVAATSTSRAAEFRRPLNAALLASTRLPLRLNSLYTLPEINVLVGGTVTQDFSEAVTADPQATLTFTVNLVSPLASFTVTGSSAAFTGVTRGVTGYSVTITDGVTTLTTGSALFRVRATPLAATTVSFTPPSRTYQLSHTTAGPTVLSPTNTASVSAPSPAVTGRVTYSLQGANAASYSIDSTSSVITYLGSGEAANTVHYITKVADVAQTATAAAGQGFQTIIVRFADSPTALAAPVFSSATYTFTMRAGTVPPFQIGQVLAVGENVVFSIVGGNTNVRQQFAVGATSGNFLFSGPDAPTLAVGNRSLQVQGLAQRGTERSAPAFATVNVNVLPPLTGFEINPNFVPSLSRSIVVGGNFSIDFSSGFQGGNTASPLQTVNHTGNTQIVSVTRSGNVYNFVGLREGSTAVAIVGYRQDAPTETATLTVLITVHRVAPTATTGRWFRGGAVSPVTRRVIALPITSLNVSVTEGAAETNALGSNALYFVTEQVNDRTISFYESPDVDGLVIGNDSPAFVNIDIGGSAPQSNVRARSLQVNLDGTEFDYERARTVNTIIRADVAAGSVSGTSYASGSFSLPLTINVTDVNEPPHATLPAGQRSETHVLRIGGASFTRDFTDLWSDPEGRTVELRVTRTGTGTASLTSGNSLNLAIQPGTAIGTNTFTVKAWDGSQESTDTYTIIINTVQRAEATVTVTWQNPTAATSPVSLAENVGTGSPVYRGMYATAVSSDTSLTLPDVVYTLTELQVKSNHDESIPWRELESLETETLQGGDWFTAPTGTSWNLGVTSGDAATLAVSAVIANQVLLTAGNITADENVKMIATASVGGVVVASRIFYRTVLANKPLAINTGVTYSDIEVTAGSQDFTLDVTNAFSDPNGEPWTDSVQLSRGSPLTITNQGNKRHLIQYPATIAAAHTTTVTIGGTQAGRTITRTFRITVRPEAAAGTASITARAALTKTPNIEGIQDATNNSIEVETDPSGLGTSVSPLRLHATKSDESGGDVIYIIDPGEFFATTGGDPQIYSVTPSGSSTHWEADIGSGTNAFHLLFRLHDTIISGTVDETLNFVVRARNSNAHSLTASYTLYVRVTS